MLLQILVDNGGFGDTFECIVGMLILLVLDEVDQPELTLTQLLDEDQVLNLDV